MKIEQVLETAQGNQEIEDVLSSSFSAGLSRTLDLVKHIMYPKGEYHSGELTGEIPVKYLKNLIDKELKYIKYLTTRKPPEEKKCDCSLSQMSHDKGCKSE